LRINEIRDLINISANLPRLVNYVTLALSLQASKCGLLRPSWGITLQI